MANSNCNVRYSCALLDVAANLTRKEKREKQQHKAQTPLGRRCLQEMQPLDLGVEDITQPDAECNCRQSS